MGIAMPTCKMFTNLVLFFRHSKQFVMPKITTFKLDAKGRLTYDFDEKVFFYGILELKDLN